MTITRNILQTLETEPRIMLCTIISTTGSTPASAFSKMLVTQAGTRITGTVGGGCMEADVLKAAKKLYEENRAAILTFHLNENEYVQGLICGGSLDVLIEPHDATTIPLFKRLQERCDDGKDSVVATILSNNGKLLLKRMLEPDDAIVMNALMDEWKALLAPPIQQSTNPILHQTSNPPIRYSTAPRIADASEELRKAFHRHETRRIKLEGAELLLEPIAGTPILIIFGGGHVSKYILQTATLAGFQVTVVDDRQEYANQKRFPGAKETLAFDTVKAFNHLRINPSSYVVIVTRGHRYDEEILERAVQTEAKYIGMIGSKRKVLTTYERLVERGIEPELLKHVHAPMGLEIGASTPEEIGISVVAELIAVRRGQEGLVTHKSDVMKELLSRISQKAVSR